MQDVVKNATTESVSTMKLKTLLHSCTVDNINIVLINYKPDYTKIETKIRNKKHFRNFIETYGNSIVDEWTIGVEDGIPYMVFDLKKLVTYDKPTTREELLEIINQTIEEKGFECDLNFIDVSNIEDMNWLFAYSSFNGDISKWDVSNVKNMEGMFYCSSFDGDISKWNVSNVEDMGVMFSQSIFNGDISNWDVSNVKDMRHMFSQSIFNGDISKWDVSNVKDMSYMFCESQFNGNISDWDIKNVTDRRFMFQNCPLEKNPPEWYRNIKTPPVNHLDIF